MRGIFWVVGLAIMGSFLLGQQDGWAQEDVPSVFEGVADYLPIVNVEEVRDGDIISLENNEFRRSGVAYDTQLFGVVTEQPAVALSVTGADGTRPVVSRGTVHVNVSTRNGTIEPGDFVTSSEVVGVGMKATQPGLVLGRALAGFTSDDPEVVGQVPVVINVFFATVLDGRPLQERSIVEQASDVLKFGTAALAAQPNTAARYLVAALIVTATTLLGFFVFGRSATHGVVAVGRNPLARRSILLAVSFNVFMTVAFVGAGVAVAVFVLLT